MFIESFKNIRLELHTIGHIKQGESIIVSILEKNNPIFTGIIDCYQEIGVEENPKPEEKLVNNFLDYLKIDMLDFCCWTHPHHDHCKGFSEVLKEKTSNKTIFYLPEGIYESNLEDINLTEENKETIKKINGNLKKSQISSINILENEENFCRKITLKTFKSPSLEKKLNLIFVAPYSSIIRKDLDGKTKKKHPNNYSIAFILDFFGEIKFFLSGDIENKTIDKFNPNFLEGVWALKAPHHSSKSADHILSLIKNKPLIFTTVYRMTKDYLPTIQMADRYKKTSKNYICTGNIACPSEDKYECGIISLNYNSGEDKVIYKLSGNASEY